MPGGRSPSSCFPISASRSPDPGLARILATVPYIVPPLSPPAPLAGAPQSSRSTAARTFDRGRLLGLVDQPQADRLAHGLDAVGHRQLAVDVGHMGVDGALGQLQAPRHLAG